jgi:acid phosphatase type 7
MAKTHPVSHPHPQPTVLHQGQVAPRPPRGRAQAHPGVAPLTSFAQGSQKFQPLPDPLGSPPYHYTLESAIPDILEQSTKLGKVVFHVVGDTGGIKDPEYQADVAAAMKGDLNRTDGTAPRFFYHLGDVVYYNGQIADYYSQFYEPYNHYDAPIISIPGNHDGDPADASQVSLDGWVRYFMTPSPRINPESHDDPRTTMSLPNVYFTLECPFVTIVGMYTNVPEGGSIDSVQQQWLTNEFATAPEDKALIVALHHPIYSFDDVHSGSPRMADAVQHAINDSRRLPNMVLTGHVHNYQRIERNALVDDATTMVPFIVAGHGGYYHLHGLSIDADPDDTGAYRDVADPETGAQLIYANNTNHGYMTLTVDKKKIRGVMSTIAEKKSEGQVDADTFEYPTTLKKLKTSQVVSL